MFCRKCGAAIPDGAKFCRACGAPVQQQPGTAQPGGPGAPAAPGQLSAPSYASPANPGWPTATKSALDKSVLGKLTLRDCLFAALALVIAISMLSRWVSIPLADIAQAIDGATGGYSSSSEFDGLNDIQYSVPGIGDMASSAKATLDLAGSSDLDDLEEIIDTRSLSSSLGAMGFIVFLWAVGLVVAIAGVAARLCGRKPYAFLTGAGICALVSLIMMIGVGSINSSINSAISSQASVLGADLDIDITWVKVTAAPVITLICSLASIALSALDLRRKTA